MSLVATMFEASATLQRPTVGRDASRGTTQDPFVNVANAVGVPCSFQQAGATVAMLYAQRNAEVNCTLYFAQGLGAEPNDRLVVTDLTGTVTLLVQSQMTPVARGRLWSVDCLYVRAPK